MYILVENEPRQVYGDGERKRERTCEKQKQTRRLRWKEVGEWMMC
jgi:hypothetical protein